MVLGLVRSSLQGVERCGSDRAEGEALSGQLPRCSRRLLVRRCRRLPSRRPQLARPGLPQLPSRFSSGPRTPGRLVGSRCSSHDTDLPRQWLGAAMRERPGDRRDRSSIRPSGARKGRAAAAARRQNRSRTAAGRRPSPGNQSWYPGSTSARVRPRRLSQFTPHPTRREPCKNP